MEIDGVSQTSGRDRVVKVTATSGGVQVAVHDRGGAAKGVAVVAADALADALAEPKVGMQVIPSLVGGGLGVEVRRNEVWLQVGSADAAVGLDDLMDAVGAATP